MRTIALLTISNVFMTAAWYGHLKEEFRWNYLVGFSLIIGTVFFIFHKW